MQANKSRDTKPELALGRLLWSCGIRYRKHSRRVAGKPDFCISKYRLAIFVDGEFWHGRDWERRRTKLKSNRDFWIAKIERNMQRDREVTRKLESKGWKVFRFWETDISKNPGMCVSAVLRYLDECRNLDHPLYIPYDYAEYPETTSLAAEPTEEYHTSPIF